MDFRSKTWIPLLALALAGCGAKDEPSAGSGGSTAGGGPKGATEAAVVQVDLNDSRELDGLLKSGDIENPPVAGEATHRGAGEKFDATIFPIYPRGQVRLDGLTAFRLDIDVENFQDGGALEFHVGKKVLWKQADVFAPKFRTTTGSVPRTVVDSVKVGETVKWGVFYDDPKKKDVVAEFKLVQEDQLDKRIAKLEKDRKFTSQSPLVRTLAKAKVVQNHGLLSEALSGYLAVVDTHPSITEAWKNIVDCMRRLELKNTPLFEEALLQMSSSVGTRRPDTDPFKNLPPPGENVKRAETPLTPIKPAMDGDKTAANPGMDGEPAAGTPTDGSGTSGAPAAAYARANEFYNQSKGLADSAQSEADRLAKEAFDANAAVAAALKALHKAEKEAKGSQGGGPGEERAATAEVAEAAKKLLAAQNAADAAAEAAMNAKKIAEGARYTADQADRVRQELQKIAALNGGPVPMTPPPTGDPKAGLLLAAQAARGVADLAAANAMALKLAVIDAKDAYLKAKALALAHPASQFLSKLLLKADLAYQAAQAAADAAKIAAEKAEFEAQQALEKAKQ